MVKHPLLIMTVGFTVAVGAVLGASVSNLVGGEPMAATRTVDAASLALPANYTPTKFAASVDLPKGVKPIGVAAPLAVAVKRSSAETVTAAQGTPGSTPVAAAPTVPTTTTTAPPATTPPATTPVTTPTPTPTPTSPGPVKITVPLPMLPVVPPLLPTVTVTVPQIGSVKVGGSTGTTTGSVVQQVLTGVGSLVSGH